MLFRGKDPTGAVTSSRKRFLSAASPEDVENAVKTKEFGATELCKLKGFISHADADPILRKDIEFLQ